MMNHYDEPITSNHPIKVVDGARILINCETDNEALAYIGNRRLKSCIVFKQFDDTGIYLSSVDVGFQIDTTYQSKINVADNDPVFSV